ncbi:MAG: response regulator [Elusimicrobiota bacterium]|nr:response regulator [Elusimicrobiota bacterium]
MGNTVLLIDDDADVMDVVQDALEPAGYRVAACVNGLNAMKSILAYQPALIILDVMLPGVDGYTLAITITEDAATSDLPIIVLSGFAPSEAMFRKFPQVKAFINKPFNPADLVEAARQALIKKNK